MTQRLYFLIILKKLIGDFDLYVSLDSLDATDIAAQMGCKSICLGNVISQKIFIIFKMQKKNMMLCFMVV